MAKRIPHDAKFLITMMEQKFKTPDEYKALPPVDEAIRSGDTHAMAESAVGAKLRAQDAIAAGDPEAAAKELTSILLPLFHAMHGQEMTPREVADRAAKPPTKG